MALPQVRTIGADRFLYGTDLYSWPSMSSTMGDVLPQILKSDLPDDAKAAILGGNIKRILNLS
jgi:predicted TIM-barrel fold metal-dependent hydrolase